MDNAIIRALRERAARFTSLDSPQGGDVVDVATDVGAGFVPVVGTALSARDFERAKREGDRLGMGLAAAGMLPVVGGVARAAGKARKGTRAAEATAEALRKAPQDEALRTAQENAVRMLGLPPGNTPMDRARAMGFVNPAYHATTAENINAFDNARLGKSTADNGASEWGINLAKKGHWFADRDISNQTGSHVVYPVMLKEPSKTFRSLDSMERSRRPLKNTVSVRDEEFGTRSFVVPDPRDIRSRFAAFDPARINENDIMGYATPAMLGTLALGSAGAMGAVAALRQRDEDKDKKGK